MSKAKVELKYNAEEIKQCIEPYWKETSFGKSFEDYHPQEDFYWYRCEMAGQLAGYFCCQPYVENTMNIHVCIIDKFRPYKDEIIDEWKKILSKTMPKDIDYLVAVIPKKLLNTIVFALENGFNVIEIKKDKEFGKVFIMGTDLNYFLKQEKIT